MQNPGTWIFLIQEFQATGIIPSVQNTYYPVIFRKRLFDGGYRKLPGEVYKKLEFHPATFEVVEHHIEVYCGNNNQKIVKADHPAELLNNSIATPSLVEVFFAWIKANESKVPKNSETGKGFTYCKTPRSDTRL